MIKENYMHYADQAIGELAIKLPMATEIFRSFRLDFCCGGKQTLRDACEKKNINLDEIVDRLQKLNQSQRNQFESMPLSELTRFIVQRYHEDLRSRIPELIVLAKRVEVVHRDHPESPRGLSQLLDKFHQDMLFHMMKEENVLFPLIESGRGQQAQMPVKVMTMEHDSHGRELEEIRKFTQDLVPPKDACTTWRALYQGLLKLEEELMDHIHLENNILFPNALTQQGA